MSNARRIIEPIIVDTYSLFDKKLENGSDWRIIDHQVNYNPKNLDGIYFALGIGDSCKKKDCYGNDFLISESEWKTLPKLSPKGGFDIKKRLEIA
ncbi:hypothetical protein ICI63_004612 [Salmonella enterica subsp. enterica]|nr:hypothetical protein [Salmonella enterica]EAZ6068219.1 hypothetical protein [Salmonella enterica]ECO7615860.1 hypothetical protein [Salmonella enterica]EGF4417907.1 hypothetical protein [Salmonella enterica subsp. enterica]EHY0498622.1 hypothetical protein [Salmonella enterica]